MHNLTHHDIFVLFLSLGILLSCARFFGELARRLNQPAILGEILTGIILGPTLFGNFFPQIFHFLFPETGAVSIALQGLTTLAIILFLLVAGMELDFTTVLKQGKSAIVVSLSGLLFPFAVGYFCAFFFPNLLGIHPQADPIIFALFFATALSISALPVIAKTLMDINLYHSHVGVLIMAAAIFDDLTGWLIFAVILGLISKGPSGGMHIWQTILLTFSFATFMFTLGKWLIHRALPWIHAHTSWPGGILGFALSLALLASAFTEWIGIHAIFGAFLVGIALGDSSHLRKQTRVTLEQFISFIFAPLFFASIGLRINFITHFNGFLCLTVLFIACLGKILGCFLGGRTSGLPPRECWALAFGLNARGAMEIILGLLALQYQLITEPMFEALVIMALITSMMSGPLMQRILKRKSPKRFTSFLSNKTFAFLPDRLNREEVINNLSAVMSRNTGISTEEIQAAVLLRERVASTGTGNGIAIPHARMPNLSRPVITLGISKGGVDFDAPDGTPAFLIFFILTHIDDDTTQIEILSDLAKTFKDSFFVSKAREVGNFTEFLGLIKSGEQAHY